MKMPSTLAKRPLLITAAVLGALSLGFSATPVSADTGGTGDAPHVVVSYGDLDVSTSSGAATLYRRIDMAAHRVCQSYDHAADILQIRTYSLERACIHQAIARAVSKVGVDRLVAIYNARNHWHR